MSYHGLLAAVGLLLATSRLGLAGHHTTTIISTTEETRTITAAQLSASESSTTPINGTGHAGVSSMTVAAAAAAAAAAVTPAPDPSISTVDPTQAPISASQLYFTIAVEQAQLLTLAENGPPPGVLRIQARAASPQDESELSQGMGAAPQPATGEGVVIAAETAPGSTTFDPADGGFLGGSPPNTQVDLPITIIFLVLFVAGAFTHISIYKANSKRGHKFLLSDLMFDFCMVRTVTCIFRIIWVFIHPRGVILAAQIFFNGGAAVIFAVNIILTQRIVRSMHPRFGWSKGFSIGTRVLAISVPINIVFQISSLIALFFSVGDENRLEAFEDCLKVGSSWNLFLVSFPFLAISAACAIPGPRPEKFGVGSLRVKTSMVLLAAVMLGTGATIRTYATFNQMPPNTTDVLFSKAVFYPTQFTLEILVVAMYALLRFDLLFHIPNGSKAPGDYAHGGKDGDPEKASLLTRADIEERISNCGVPHQILKTSYEKDTTIPGVEQPIYAIFFPSTVIKASAQAMEEALKEGDALERPKRVSRRQSLLEALERKSERDRKAVGRADRRSVASRRSHWGYAHLQRAPSMASGSMTQVASRGVDRTGARSRTPPEEYINFVPLHSDEWVLPEYPHDGRPGYRTEKTPANVSQSRYVPGPDEAQEYASPMTSPSPSLQQQQSSPRSRSSPTSYYPPEAYASSERSSANWRERRERVPSVAQITAERGSTGSSRAPARPYRDLESMYHAGQDRVLKPPNPGNRGRH